MKNKRKSKKNKEIILYCCPVFIVNIVLLIGMIAIPLAAEQLKFVLVLLWVLSIMLSSSVAGYFICRYFIKYCNRQIKYTKVNLIKDVFISCIFILMVITYYSQDKFNSINAYCWAVMVSIILLVEIIYVVVKNVKNYKLRLVIDISTLFVFTIYLLSKIPDSLTNLREVTATMVGVIYTGLIAWGSILFSIKQQKDLDANNAIRQAKPLLTFIFQAKPEYHCNEATCMINTQYSKSISKYSTYAKLVNSNNSHFTITKFCYEGQWYRPRLNNVIIEGSSFWLVLNSDKYVSKWENSDCYIEIKDPMEHLYYYRLVYECYESNMEKYNFLAELSEVSIEDIPYKDACICE